jgi:hypothetical protein
MRSHATAALAAVVVAATAAGCGSSSNPRQPASSGPIKFADCMRSHGVPSFPDPISGAGFDFQSTGINPASPAFQQARLACKEFAPSLGNGPPATEQQKTSMLALSRCMRAHGVSGFPDPVSKAPAPGAGFKLAFGAPGAIIAIPTAMDLSAPVFTQAAIACGFPGTGHGAQAAAP